MNASTLKQLQSQAIDELLRILPAQAGSFEGSQFPLPVKTAFLADSPLDVGALRAELLAHRDGDLKQLLEPVLLAAEAVESAQPDRAGLFLNDLKVQGLVFSGSKWRAGWVLVLGDKRHSETVDLLHEREFIVFSDHPGLEKATFVGDRLTAPVYFLQMMVRYGLVWGRIKPGDDHAMGHFLETDMPGLIVVTENLPALKYLVVLGLMKLGAPAIVPPDYPFPYGNRIPADGPAQASEAIRGFSNLRVLHHEHEEIRLPDFCNPAHLQEDFAPASRIGGSEPSFFLLRKTTAPLQELAIEGEPGSEVGIVVEIDEPRLSPDVAKTIESDALRSIGFIRGLRAGTSEGVLTIELADGVRFDAASVAQAIRQGIRFRYPQMDKIGVRLIWDKARLKEEWGHAAGQRREREQFIAAMSEENTDQFGVCTECRPFSLEHTCILTPDRLPMCATRTYHTVKAAALFGWTVTPYKRRAEENLPLRMLFDKGAVIDAEKGEYAGVNRIYSEMTRGTLPRVQLHSLRECPPTSCGCFQNLAFWLNDVAGIAIMSRNSPARAPDGSRWYELANRAGGKRSAGIYGVSTSYIRSKHFLKGDGGLANVVWVDQKLKKTLADALPPGARVATEADVTTLQELKKFLGR